MRPHYPPLCRPAPAPPRPAPQGSEKIRPTGSRKPARGGLPAQVSTAYGTVHYKEPLNLFKIRVNSMSGFPSSQMTWESGHMQPMPNG